MRLALTLLLVVACSGPRDPDPSSAEDPSGEDARPWRAIAAPARLDAADAALGRLDGSRRQAVEDLLDRMAGFGLGPEALRQAGALAEANAGIAADPEWAGSGTAPGTHALYVGGLAVLSGMASASAREDPATAADLVQTICSMPMPQHFNSGGRESDAAPRAALCDAVDAALPAGTPAPARGPGCGL